jgi:hypothetical protein
MGVRTEKTLFLLLATVMGRYPPPRSMKHVCRCQTCFGTGLSQYIFHDERRIEEKSTLLIQWMIVPVPIEQSFILLTE